jgi:hypothetical protein
MIWKYVSFREIPSSLARRVWAEDVHSVGRSLVSDIPVSAPMGHELLERDILLVSHVSVATAGLCRRIRVLLEGTVVSMWNRYLYPDITSKNGEM